MSRISPVNRNLLGCFRTNRKVDNKDGLTANLSYNYPALRAPLLKSEGEFLGRGTQGAAKHRGCSPRKGDAWPWAQWRSIMETNCNNRLFPRHRLLPPFRGEKHVFIIASVSRAAGGLHAPCFYRAIAPVGATFSYDPTNDQPPLAVGRWLLESIS